MTTFVHMYGYNSGCRGCQYQLTYCQHRDNMFSIVHLFIGGTMSPCLLGIDFGTGGAKAAIIDSEGTLLGYGFEEYPLIHDHPGWSEHDPENYWKAAQRIIRKAAADAGIAPHAIKGVAVSSALPSLVMTDNRGNPVSRAYNLLDKRAVAEVQWLQEHIGEDRIFQISGYRTEDHPVLVNLMWEKRNRPELFSRIDKALTIDGFITMKLTGKPSLNYSSAAFFGVAYNMRKGEFDNTLLDEIEISPGLFPEIYQCTDIVGEVTPGGAEAAGLVPGIPVAAGQVDCNASWIGAGAVTEGDLQCNLGTVGNFGIIHKSREYNYSDIGRLMINFPYTIEGTFVTVPTTLTGGQCLRFIRDTFSQIEVQREMSGGESAYDQLSLQAEKAPPGSGGLIVLPFLMGERTPIWDPHARGTIFGLSLDHTKGHLVRAMMEGVAFALYDSFRLIRDKGELPINYPMILNEGGAVSRLWRKIITDVFNIPTAMVKQRAGAPYGDALLAGVAAGIFKDFTPAREWAEYVEHLEPEEKTHKIYQEYFCMFKDLYNHLADDFKQLTKLRAQEKER